MSAPKFKMLTIVLDAETLAGLEALAAAAKKDRLQTAAELIKAIVEDDRAAHGAAQ